jgi:hypothetical protein
MKLWRGQPDNWKPVPLPRKWRIAGLVTITIWCSYNAYHALSATLDVCSYSSIFSCRLASFFASLLPISRNTALADVYIALGLVAWVYEITVLKNKP